MRFLVDMHCFDCDTTEGINTYLKGLYSELIKIENITFVFVAEKIEKLKLIFGTPNNIIYVPLSNKGRIYRLTLEFPLIIRKYKVDYAHFQYTSPFIKNCKNIITLHDILFKDYPSLFPLSYRTIRDFMFRLSAKRSDILLTVSEYSKERIAFHYNIPRGSIYVTPNAVSKEFAECDIDEAREFVKQKGVDKFILYVSRIEPRKNHITLLKSYVELELWRKGYKLVFIGRKTIDDAALDNYLDNLDEEIRENVLVINQTNFANLIKWYSAAGLFVYPSLAEGFGIPPLESVVAGASTICSNKTAMSDFRIFENDFFDPNDKEQLKSLIIRKLSEGNCNSNINRASVLQEYSWRESAIRFISAIKTQKSPNQ